MENLARSGRRDPATVAQVDGVIARELAEAHIDTITAPLDAQVGEVPFTVMGALGPFKFRRAWYYWRVEGPMPLALAEKLYTDPVGQDARVAGMSGGDSPARHVRRGAVWSYNIDTQEALNLFAKTIRDNEAAIAAFVESSR